jgi:hypothetical protein
MPLTDHNSNQPRQTDATHNFNASQRSDAILPHNIQPGITLLYIIETTLHYTTHLLKLTTC